MSKTLVQHGIICDVAGNDGKYRKIKGYNEF